MNFASDILDDIFDDLGKNSVAPKLVLPNESLTQGNIFTQDHSKYMNITKPFDDLTNGPNNGYSASIETMTSNMSAGGTDADITIQAGNCFPIIVPGTGTINIPSSYGAPNTQAYIDYVKGLCKKNKTCQGVYVTGNPRQIQLRYCPCGPGAPARGANGCSYNCNPQGTSCDVPQGGITMILDKTEDNLQDYEKYQADKIKAAEEEIYMSTLYSDDKIIAMQKAKSAQLENTIKDKENLYRKLINQSDLQKTTIDTANKKISDVQKLITVNTGNLNTVTSELNTEKNDLTQVTAVLAKTNAELTSLTKKLADERTKNQHLKTEEGQEMAQIKSLTNQFAQANASIAKLQSNIANTNLEITEKDSLIKATLKAEGADQNEIQELTKKHDELIQNYEKVGLQIDNVKHSIEKVDDELKKYGAMTDKGPCIFPFEYAGKMHSLCVTGPPGDEGKSWCPVTQGPNYDANSIGYCKKSAIAEVISKLKSQINNWSSILIKLKKQRAMEKSAFLQIQSKILTSDDHILQALNALDDAHNATLPMSSYNQSALTKSDEGNKKIQDYKSSDPLFIKYKTTLDGYQKKYDMLSNKATNLSSIDNTSSRCPMSHPYAFDGTSMQGEYCCDNPINSSDTTKCPGEKDTGQGSISKCDQPPCGDYIDFTPYDTVKSEYMNLRQLSSEIKTKIQKLNGKEQHLIELWGSAFGNVQGMINEYQRKIKNEYNVDPVTMSLLDGKQESGHLKMESYSYAYLLWGFLTVVMLGVTIHFYLYSGFKSVGFFVGIIIFSALSFVFYSAYEYFKKHQIIIR